MRLKIINTVDLDNNNICVMTREMLVAEYEKDSNIIITDENPDVVHIIGAWTPSAKKIANDALRRYITLLYTPLGSLSPWYKPTTYNVKLSSKATALIASGEMEKELLGGHEMKNLYLILNAVTTATTTASTMAEEYKVLYKESAERTDISLWDEVNRKISMLKEKDESILEICKNLLYAQYLYQRRRISHQFLNNLAALMTRSNYDEDKMEEVLKLINLHTFTQHLEYVMKEKSSLTEGFMPIFWKKDKVSEKMIELVTDY